MTTENVTAIRPTEPPDYRARFEDLASEVRTARGRLYVAACALRSPEANCCAGDVAELIDCVICGELSEALERLEPAVEREEAQS